MMSIPTVELISNNGINEVQPCYLTFRASTPQCNMPLRIIAKTSESVATPATPFGAIKAISLPLGLVYWDLTANG